MKQNDNYESEDRAMPEVTGGKSELSENRGKSTFSVEENSHEIPTFDEDGVIADTQNYLQEDGSLIIRNEKIDSHFEKFQLLSVLSIGLLMVIATLFHTLWDVKKFNGGEI